MGKEIEQIKALIKKSNKITILSGAGMSTESGIADFRSPAGVWTKYKTVTIQEFLSDPEKRKYYWQYKSDTIPAMLKAQPNPGHYAIGKLDKLQKLLMLLTQNIDGLHERGGVNKKRIIRLHGTNSEVICLSCNEISDIKPVIERVKNGEDVPRCRQCNGFLKPNTVSFGQSLNPEHLTIAERVSQECDLFIALGSSLLVQPASSFVEVANRSNKDIIIINRDETPYDSMAMFKLSGQLGEILPAIIE